MGCSSYNGVLNRILDNQMLDNLIETGVLGAIAYIMMPVVVLATSAPLIRDRRTERALETPSVPGWGRSSS